MRKDLLINAIGIGGGQAIVLIATPFLARIYSPAEFGQYAAVVAASSVVATVASMRFDVALPAVSEKDVQPLFQVALFLPILVISCIYLALSESTSLLEDSLPIGVADLFLASLLASLIGTTNVCQAIFIRDGDFRRIATLKVLQPTIFAGAAFYVYLGLNGALIASWIAVLLFALGRCRVLLTSFNPQKSFLAIRRAAKYPMLSTPVAILDTASLALPLFFILFSFGNESAGSYSQVQRLLAAPLILLGAAAAQVFYKHAGDLRRRGDAVEPLMWRIFGTLSGLALLLTIATWMAGEPILLIILGPGWRIDLQFLLLSVAPVLIRMTVSPITSIFMLTNRLGLGAGWQVLYFLTTVMVMFLSHDRLTLEDYLLALAASEFLMYTLYLTLAVFALRIDSRRL